MTEEVRNITRAMSDQVHEARAAGFEPERVILAPQDYMMWWRALGAPMRRALGELRFGGVLVQEDAALNPGVVRVVVDATTRGST